MPKVSVKDSVVLPSVVLDVAAKFKADDKQRKLVKQLTEAKDKQQLPITDPYYDRLNLFLKFSNNETDRGRALVAVSLIEEMLEEILRNFLLVNNETKNLFESSNAPLSTFSAKSLICRSLSLITKEEFKDIDTIRPIRNEFAHNIMCSFDQQKIADLSASLTFGMGYLDRLPKDDKSRVEDPKSRFGMVSTSLVVGLYNRARYVKKNKIQESAYPD